ncbi:hypothetical protein SSAG_06935 [Streptomyces sp. Mg1]|nr:hypothetical protein SSAG_06935 [Streptomyces sp. Mg1]
MGRGCGRLSALSSRRYDAERGGLPEIAELLAGPALPAKTNLLLRWTRADGADARYLPLPNPLRE